MIQVAVKESLKSRIVGKSYRASYIVRKSGRLPTYTGSMIRGIFGRALKRVYCTVPHGDCLNCRYYDTCNYVDFFERMEAEDTNGTSSLPRPFTFQNLPEGREYSLNEIINFDLLLFGKASESSSYFCKTLEWMALFPWMSSEIWLDFHSLEPIHNNLSQLDGSIQEYIEGFDFSDSMEKFRIQFLTPVRLKFQNSELRKMKARALSFHLIQRYRLLNSFYGTLESADIERVGSLEIEKISEKYLLPERYSYRQNKRHILPGIIGEYNLFISDPILKKLLVFGFLTNIGKNTSFGYGNFVIMEGLKYGTQS